MSNSSQGFQLYLLMSGYCVHSRDKSTEQGIFNASRLDPWIEWMGIRILQEGQAKDPTKWMDTQLLMILE
ncbi:hypothetical protein PROFUN_04683 [Planoprotostelium fungivorum]|uniref:Uncharacterized protein n=1 Tax=Planoprotostelium fungivorum TaxID=1890364 RepID=A0A2P6NFT4_9EUKA|nr:hypothetical protein PROFUN_04683 [Planoprotostelium fungivorum]